MMTDNPEVRAYLDRLDRALASVPFGTASELRAGIAEELNATDEVTARARMQALGDPEDVAAAARTDHEASIAPPVSASRRPATASTAYTIVACALVAIGGIVVPVVGWVFGIALVWASPLWRRSQKWIATVAPIVLAVATEVIARVIQRIAHVERVGGGINPLMPTGASIVWNVAFLAAGVAVLTGVWLLVIGLRARP